MEVFRATIPKDAEDFAGLCKDEIADAGLLVLFREKKPAVRF